MPHEFKEAPAGVVVLHMDLKVFREMFDTLAQQGYLHLGRTGVGVVNPVLLNDLSPLLRNNPHGSVVFLSFLVFVA